MIDTLNHLIQTHLDASWDVWHVARIALIAIAVSGFVDLLAARR